MKRLLANAAERLAPRTVGNLRKLSALDPPLQHEVPLLVSYQRELRSLQRQVDELRRDQRRVAELYDAVFEWMHQGAAVRGVAPAVNGQSSVDRVAKELSEGQ